VGLNAARLAAVTLANDVDALPAPTLLFREDQLVVARQAQAVFLAVVGNADLLLGCRRVDVPNDLDEILLGALGPVDEGEDADEQREKRDQREEELVRDRAGEERAIVVREALDGGSAARNRAG